MNAVHKFSITIGFVGALFGLFSNVTPALACSCVMATPTEQFNNAAVVFVGTVRSITTDGVSNSVGFNVSELQKGSSVKTITVITHQQESACGFDFKEGKDYVVYAYEEDGKLGTGICTGTALVADSQDDIDNFGFVSSPSESTVESKKGENSLTLIVVSSVLSFVAGALMVRVVESQQKIR